jgi:hypothetical protein
MAGIVLTIEELRPNISSKFSDSRKNPIKRILRKRLDASVQSSRPAVKPARRRSNPENANPEDPNPENQ